MTVHYPTGNLLLNVFRGQPNSYSNLYLGLFTASPATNGTPTNEVGDLYNYSRMAVTFLTPSNGIMGVAGVPLTFPQASGPWGTVSHVGLCTGTATSATGQVLISGSLTTPVAILANQSLRFNNIFLRFF